MAFIANEHGAVIQRLVSLLVVIWILFALVFCGTVVIAMIAARVL